MKREETVGYKIRLIHNRVHKFMEERRSENEADLSLTGMQRYTMGYLNEHQTEEVFQRDLEREFSISRATASNLLTVMERKGLIIRKSVKQDARLKKIELTQKGRTLVTRAESDILEMEELLTRGMSKEEKTQFLSLLDHVLLNLKQIDA